MNDKPQRACIQFHLSTAILLMFAAGVFMTAFYYVAAYRYIPCNYCHGKWDPAAYSKANGVPLGVVRKDCPNCQNHGKISYLTWFLD